MKVENNTIVESYFWREKTIIAYRVNRALDSLLILLDCVQSEINTSLYNRTVTMVAFKRGLETC